MPLPELNFQFIKFFLKSLSIPLLSFHRSLVQYILNYAVPPKELHASFQHVLLNTIESLCCRQRTFKENSNCKTALNSERTSLENTAKHKATTHFWKKFWVLLLLNKDGAIFCILYIQVMYPGTIVQCTFWKQTRTLISSRTITLLVLISHKNIIFKIWCCYKAF